MGFCFLLEISVIRLVKVSAKRYVVNIARNHFDVAKQSAADALTTD